MISFDSEEVQLEFHEKCDLDEQLFWQSAIKDLEKKGLSVIVVAVRKIAGDGIPRMRLQRSEVLARIY